MGPSKEVAAATDCKQQTGVFVDARDTFSLCDLFTLPFFCI